MEEAPKPPPEQVLRSILTSVSGRDLSPGELADLGVEVARVLLTLCQQHTTARDREQAQILGRMMQDRRGQVFTTLLTDRAYRSSSLRRAVEQARYLLDRIGPPEYLGSLERFSLRALRRVGSWVPTLSGTAMLNRIEAETSAFVLPAGKELDGYLEKRHAEGTRVNINHLGEEVLGEQEAERRLTGYLEL